MKKLKSLLWAILSVPVVSSAQTVVINELQAANLDMYVDPSFNYGSWMELYNPTDKPVSLNGWYVSDDPTNLKKYPLGKKRGAVKPGGYMVLWFDNHSSYAPMQIDTKLDVEGGAIYLSNLQGKLVASVTYPETYSRTSYARMTDGTGGWGITAQPTPGRSNAGSPFAVKRLQAPSVNRDGGLYKSSLTVKVTIPTGTTLRYTTDGSTPTEKNGMVSTSGQFRMTSTKVFRFRLFQDGYLPSPVVTRSYIFTDQEFDLPVISVVTDPVNLYDDSLGILVKGVNGRPGNGQDTPCNWNMDWERPVNVEYFTTGGQMVVNQEAHMERCGGWSRAWAPSSFKIKANKIYEGQNFIPYQVFPQKAYLKHKTWQVRNGGNDNNSRIKDAALQTIVHTSGLDVDGQECQPVVHFINGEYKGVLNIREPNNKHFVEANYALDEDEIDQFEMSPDSGYIQKCGTDESILQWYSLSMRAADAATYEKICSLVDIDEYINYMAVELYLGSDDWPQNNVKGFKPRYEGGKFRFVLFDLDHSFNLSSNAFETFAGKSNYSFAHASGSSVGMQGGIKLVSIFLNMLKNDTFRKQFIDTYSLVAGSVFVPERCNVIIDSMARNTEKALGLEGKSPWWTADDLKSRLSGRQQMMTGALKNYAPMKLSSTSGQRVKFSANLPQAHLLMNGLPVPTDKFDGTLFAPVTLEARAPAGYRFVGWVNHSASQKWLFGKNATWHYYDQGSMDGKDWKTTLMSHWPAGKAPLGYYTGDTNNSRGYNTTLDYGPDASNKRPTYYFSKEFTIDYTPSSNDVYTFDFRADDGLVVYVNGQEAGRYLMNEGQVYYNTYASTYAAGNPDQGSMTLPARLFKKGKNVIAVEVHNNNGTSTDIFFDALLGVSQVSDERNLLSTEEEVTLPAGEDLSLTAIYEPLSDGPLPAGQWAPPVRVNEVSADNSIYVNPTYFKRNDWIELYNATRQPVDVAGMYLTDEAADPYKFQIPTDGSIPTIIGPHGFWIVWADKLEAIQQCHASFKLDKDGGYVMLTAADRAWSDTLSYPAHMGTESVGLYPDGGTDVYLMNSPTIAASNQISSYAEYVIEPDIPSSIGLPEEKSGENMVSLAYADGYLEMMSRQPLCAHIALYTVGGQCLMQKRVELQPSPSFCPVGQLPTGIYVVRLQDSQGCTYYLKFRI